jgi:hypothetical protein
MKDICEGRRTKNDVVQESLVMYREVFMKANREVNVLVEVYLLEFYLTSGMSAIPTGGKLVRFQRDEMIFYQLLRDLEQINVTISSRDALKQNYT